MRWIINPQFFSAKWPAPANIKTLITTRQGGVSQAPFDSFNLGDHVADDENCVRNNRAALAQFLPQAPIWLTQVHGLDLLELKAVEKLSAPEADGSYTTELNQVCCVMTADCLPVLFCNKQGTQVAAAHAGWRGLLNGILELTVKKFDAEDVIYAYLGPAIGPDAFEVGEEVKAAFCGYSQQAQQAFTPSENEGKWLADIYTLAHMRLKDAGVTHIYGGDMCTYSDEKQFFSYRRDGQTGRMASCIWMEA